MKPIEWAPSALVFVMGAAGLMVADYYKVIDIGIFASPLVRTCRVEIQSRLRSPSSYSEISSTDNLPQAIPLDEARQQILDENKSEATVAKFEAQMFDEHRAEMEAGTYPRPLLYTAIISYDASNLMGVPLRGMSECSYLAKDGSLKYLSDYVVKVDGQSHLEYTLAQINALNNPQ